MSDPKGLTEEGVVRQDSSLFIRILVNELQTNYIVSAKIISTSAGGTGIPCSPDLNNKQFDVPSDSGSLTLRSHSSITGISIIVAFVSFH